MGNVATEKLTSSCKANAFRIAQIDKTFPGKLLQTLQFIFKVVVKVDAEAIFKFMPVNFKPGQNMILDEFVPQMIVVIVPIRPVQINGYLTRIDHPVIIFDARYRPVKAFVEKANRRGPKTEIVELVIL